jgi:hypothetical protein
MKRYFFLSVVLLVAIQNITAQVPGSNKKITRMPLFFEKAYLHTDRQQYAPGDDVWFQSYLVNGQNNILTHNSSTLYVELISPSADVISSEVVRLENGAGAGDFQLPATLPSGMYRLRAYTNWMLNYGKMFVFEKTIEVAKKQRKEYAPDNNEFKIDLQFFPEGGRLVEDVTSLVAFKAMSSWGKSCEVQGWVFSDLGDTVARFASSYMGMGRFTFKSEKNRTYFVVGNSGGYSFKADIPQCSASGFVMHVAEADSGNYTVRVCTNQATIDADGGYDFLLTGSNRGKRFFKNQLELSDTSVTVSVPKNLFPEGISCLTLYDERMRPCCERLLYREPNSRQKTTIITSKPEYKIRDSISVKIKLTDESKPIKANISVSVVNGLSAASPGNMYSYLWLESEIRGTIENPAAYFDTRNIDRLKQMELLLLTQGWRSFVWQQLADTTIVIRHIMEQGLNLSGKVRDQLLNKPYPNAVVSLTVLGAQKNGFLTANTDSLGKFYFQGLDFYGKKKVTLVSKNQEGKNAGWILFDTTSAVQLPVEKLPVPLMNQRDTSQLKVFLENDKRMNRKTTLADTMMLHEVKIKAPRSVAEQQEAASSMYGIAEYDCKLTDEDRTYGDFTGFILSKVKYSTIIAPDTCSNPLNHILIGPLPDPDSKYFRPILVLNDKQLTYEMYRDTSTFHDDNGDCVDDGDEERESELYEIPLKYIERIMVFRRIANMSIGGQGIPAGYYVISVYTTPEFRFPDKEVFYKQTIEVTGYYKARTFYSPLYDKERGPRTDDRTTLYWSSGIKTNDNGEATIRYFNADTKGPMRIEVQGIGEKGEVISAVKTYLVK